MHSVGIFDWFVKDDKMVWSEQQGQILGLGPDEFEGRFSDWIARLLPEEGTALQVDLFAAMAERAPSYCFAVRARRTDGEIRDLEGAGRILYDGAGLPERFIATALDVTERKRMEYDLGQKEAWLQLALDVAQLGTCELDLTTDRAVRSLRHDQIFGYKESLPEWGLANFEAHVVEEDQPAFREALERAIETGVASLEARVRGPDNSIRWISAYGRTSYENGTPVRIAGIVSDVTEHKKNEERVRQLRGEINHRAKNLLALVQAIVWQTADSCVPREFAARLNERLRALAASNDLLVGNAWQHVDLRGLVLAQLDPFVNVLSNRVRLSGPDVKLRPAAVQVLGMAFHELATNAVKYGALSNSAGTLSVGWNVLETVSGPVFHINWREAGGPPVQPPRSAGFGSTVIVDSAEYAVNAEVELKFPDSGVEWQLLAPLEEITAAPITRMVTASGQPRE